MSPAPTEPRGMLTTEEMVAELYRSVCVSRSGEPCLIDKVNAHDAQIRELQGNTWIAFCTRHAMATIITLFITFLAAVFGRGLIVSILAEAQTASGL